MGNGKLASLGSRCPVAIKKPLPLRSHSMVHCTNGAVAPPHCTISAVHQRCNCTSALHQMPTHEPRCRWAVPLRLRPLRMTDLSAGECLVRLTGRADTPPQPAAAVIPVPHCASLRHRQCNTCGSRRSADGGCGDAPGSLHWYRARPSSSTRS